METHPAAPGFWLGPIVEWHLPIHDPTILFLRTEADTPPLPPRKKHPPILCEFMIVWFIDYLSLTNNHIPNQNINFSETQSQNLKVDVSAKSSPCESQVKSKTESINKKSGNPTNPKIVGTPTVLNNPNTRLESGVRPFLTDPLLFLAH